MVNHQQPALPPLYELKQLSSAQDIWSFTPANGLNHQVVSVWYHVVEVQGAKDLNILLSCFCKYPDKHRER